MIIRNDKGRFEKGSGKIDITGEKNGKLTAVRFDHRTEKRTYWLFKCDCGNEKIMDMSLRKQIKSCGCLVREGVISNFGRPNHHGMSYHPAYTIWCNIMARCYNPKHKSYRDYGERGISVCDEWKEPCAFCRWMDEHSYVKGLTIERVDVNGNYEPENCSLIPKGEQSLNKRNTTYVTTDKGEFAIAKETHKNGLSYRTVSARIRRGETEYDRIFYKGKLENRKNG